MEPGVVYWRRTFPGTVTPQSRRVPRISEFHGIVIAMYYSDHAPPHFHAASGGAEASLLIETLEVLEGSLANWERARRGEPLDKIPPLE